MQRALFLVAQAAILLAMPVPATAQAPATASGGGTAPPSLPATCSALPVLPLPAGAKLMGHGDSILGLGESLQTLALSSRMSSILDTAWADNPDFQFDNWYDPSDPWIASGTHDWSGSNQGVPSDHLDWASAKFGDGILPRTRYTLGRGPAIVYLQGGGNSINSGDGTGEPGAGGYDASTNRTTPSSAAYVESKLDATINQFTCRGVWVILQTILPDAFWPSGDPRHQTIRDVNVWIRAQSGRAGVKVIDPYNAFVSPSDPDAVRQELYQEQINLSASPPVYGGVHLNAAGAWLLYRDYLKPVLATMIAPGQVFSQDATDTNLAPSSVALMNGGTTGAMTGSVPPTGHIATGWSAAATRGSSTIVASLDGSPGSYTRQVFTITPVNDGYTDAGGGAHELDFNAPLITVNLPAAGSWVRTYIHVETPDLAFGAGPSLIYSDVSLNNGGTTILRSRGMNEFTTYTAISNYGRGGYWLATPPFQVPASPYTNIKVSVVARWPKTTPTPITIKYDRLIVRTVPDPRTIWNLH